MDADQIVKLTYEAIGELLNARAVNAGPKQPPGMRRSERWPFPGAVEVWLPNECYGEQHMLATLHNMSEHGMAMRSRRPIQTGTKISIAIHEPDLSVYGHAVVRHCTRVQAGYLVGVEFIFEAEEAEEEHDED